MLGRPQLILFSSYDSLVYLQYIISHINNCTVSPQKFYYFDVHESIPIGLGTNVTEEVGNQKVFPPHLTSVSALRRKLRLFT